MASDVSRPMLETRVLINTAREPECSDNGRVGVVVGYDVPGPVVRGGKIVGTKTWDLDVRFPAVGRGGATSAAFDLDEVTPVD